MGAAWERRKAAKMRLSNAAIEQKLPKRDRQMLRVSKSCKNAIIRENRVSGRRGRGEKLLKCDCRMLQLSKSCQNAIVECGECAKAAKMRLYARTGCRGGVGEKKRC